MFFQWVNPNILLFLLLFQGSAGHPLISSLIITLPLAHRDQDSRKSHSTLWVNYEPEEQHVTSFFEQGFPLQWWATSLSAGWACIRCVSQCTKVLFNLSSLCESWTYRSHITSISARHKHNTKDQLQTWSGWTSRWLTLQWCVCVYTNNPCHPHWDQLADIHHSNSDPWNPCL